MCLCPFKKRLDQLHVWSIWVLSWIPNVVEARLPLDKVKRIYQFIQTLLLKNFCTKRELLQLLGHLNFAMLVILPGRSFVSFLIHLSTTVKNLNDTVYLDSECKTDLSLWQRFLEQWNGITLFHYKESISSDNLELFTDASASLGFGGYLQGKWFACTWPWDLPVVDGKQLSIAYKELYLIVVAAILWGKNWSKRRIVFHCDNKATVSIVNKGRSKCLHIMQLMRRLTWCACIHNFTFRSIHVPGKLNDISDSLSRLQFARFQRLAPQADKVPHLCPRHSDVIWN